MMSFVLYLSPFYLLFELWQLVVAERYLGISRIEQGVDPRKLPLGNIVAFLWTAGVVSSWVWMFLLLVDPQGRAPGACMLLVTGMGFLLRRSSPMKWILVILTFEGACRIGMMFYLCALLGRELV